MVLSITIKWFLLYAYFISSIFIFKKEVKDILTTLNLEETGIEKFEEIYPISQGKFLICISDFSIMKFDKEFKWCLDGEEGPVGDANLLINKQSYKILLYRE